MSNLYTTPEASKITGIPESTIRTWLSRHPGVFHLDVHLITDEHKQKLWTEAGIELLRSRRETKNETDDNSLFDSGTNIGKSSKSNSSSLSTGGHAIDKNQVLSPTDPTVITPLNAGSWETVRTAQVNDSPRYFTKEEADQIRAIAKGATEAARHTQRAYRGLKKIEATDAEVHKHHRNYVRGVADAELTKKRADAATARHLHRQRPEYAKLGIGLDRAEEKANNRIEELKAKFKAVR